jgi:hypothetical protein
VISHILWGAWPIRHYLTAKQSNKQLRGDFQLMSKLPFYENLICFTFLKKGGNSYYPEPGQSSYVAGSKVSGLTYKSRAKWKMLWGLYSAIYGEVNISVEKCVEIKGDYVEKWQICFISVTLKSWSGPETFGPYSVTRPHPSSFSSKTMCFS